MSKTITKKAFAKLDLGIHINPQKSKDGLFPVSYIDSQLDIYDELLFEKAKGEIEIICDDSQVPTNEENFIYQAALLLRRSVGRGDLGAKITLKKRIPVKAGFGGGSSDGAAAIWGLCELWNIKASKNQLLEFSEKLGKDFYFSLFGGLAEVKSIGREYQLKPLKSDLSFWTVVVVQNEEKPSTGWIYGHLDEKKVGNQIEKFKKLKSAIYKGDKKEILANLSNDFETSVSGYFPVVSKIKKDLADLGASGKLMAGAGLSVVGFFEDKTKAREAGKQLTKSGKYRQVLVSKTIF